MLHAFFTKNTWNALEYHLVTEEPPFTVKTINWMHQSGPRILLSVSHMLYVNQVCHGVGLCVKDESCSSSSLSESRWTVLMRHLTISTNVDTIKHMTIFSFRNTAQRCIVYVTNCKMWFSCFPDLTGSAEAQVIWGGILKHLLIAYLIGNISAKKISKSVHVCQSYSKP